MGNAVHTVAYVAAALLLLNVGYRIWDRRAERPIAAACLVAIVVGGAWWSLADAVIATGVGGPASGIAAAATFPAIGIIVAAFVCLARSASSTDWAPSRRTLALLAVEPVATTVVIATNPLHQMFYAGPGAATFSTPNEWQHGSLFWVHTVYSYGLLAIALGLVALGWWRFRGVFRRQFRSLLVASLAPILVVVVDLVGLAGDFGDPTPLGLAVTAVVLHYSIRRQDLIGLAPIARQALFERVSDLVVAISPRGLITDANPAAQALWRDATGDDGGSLTGRSGSEILRALRAEPADVSMTAVLDGDDGATADLTVEVEGRRCDLEIRSSRLTDGRGHPIGWVLVGRDVTEVNARNRQLLTQLDLIEGLHRDLAELANRDPLTHLHNRRYGMEWLVPLLTGPVPTGVCVLMIDIDEFKLVNDRYGHVMGDAVLVAMSRRLLQVMPPEALIARWGGDEFVVAVPAASASAGVALAEDLRVLCESETFTERGQRVGWTVSAGVAAFGESGVTAPELLEAADLALYAAKVGGRNRVCRHESGPPAHSEGGRPDVPTSVSNPVL